MYTVRFVFFLLTPPIISVPIGMLYEWIVASMGI